ncbi:MULTISPECIES: plasmid mobilization protein [unclassified Pseudomonas]|uniref:plasmid mobilization protein n=1 Tax=unclassified Pseudomonas TaxID=196821 RepID=UPI002AC8BF8F|nr:MULTISPECIES: plasmid mobilization relaxosome protein MobC [unclassified Pseudomonas]MEB0046979.1 plasmid mobilization relaxosome protein MobC [Pseudomonas sp. Dout3]MEB0098055.1 plasmid mobilization relaxosome protein MobC [Pseudomonas sp. DC1.2]WPX58426.1 plasmid mobilization relaxosome protein MobC [Pseudomonas sp. DC1.2]
MDKPSRSMNVHLGTELKARWTDYCLALGKSPGAAVKAAIEHQLAQAAAPELKTYQQIAETPTREPKQRFEILLTASEKAAIQERAHLERCSMRRWIIDAIRVGLTHEPQFGMDEIDALGESNYQLLRLGRNLNQIARRLNDGEYEPVTVERIEVLNGLIRKHTEVVSQAIRASLERWDIEGTSLPQKSSHV